MATLKPFAALRPRPELAARICELPYDVLSSAEARALASGNSLSFLHVSKPEIDLPPGTDIYAPKVYAKGMENFQRLIADGALQQDAGPRFYLYRQVMGTHSQVGLVAVASCEEYLRGVIKKHELTRPDKEDDRVRHIETLNAQTGPVFLTYRAVPALDQLVAEKSKEQPAIDFTARDGVAHTSWAISDPATLKRIEQEFDKVPLFYIADGHHRSAAAARVYLKQKDVNPRCRSDRDNPLASEGSPHELAGTAGHEGGEPAADAFPSPGGEGRPVLRSSTATEGGGEGGPIPLTRTLIGRAADGADGSRGFFLVVLFPHNQMQILPYNRVLKDLNGLTPARVLEQLDGPFIIQRTGSGRPTRKHELGLYLDGHWRTLHFRPKFAATSDPLEQLDVTLLQKYVLDPIWGIADPRTSNRIHFVGGIRGTAELERLVNSGEYACAFSMFPTGIEDLMTIADVGGIMPPKSTWFEPKLRDGMFCHLLE